MRRTRDGPEGAARGPDDQPGGIVRHHNEAKSGKCKAPEVYAVIIHSGGLPGYFFALPRMHPSAEESQLPLKRVRRETLNNAMAEMSGHYNLPWNTFPGIWNTVSGTCTIGNTYVFPTRKEWDVVPSTNWRGR